MEKCEMYGVCWNPPAKEKPLCPSDATDCSPSWASLLDNPRHTLRRLGVSFRDQEKMELRLHVVAEDLRYPLLCVNGDLNFGVWINPRTGDFEGGRGCICASRQNSGCICNLPNDKSDSR